MIRNQRSDSPGLVELQLLRHGPPHNQLLSPLTDYLSLCGDHPNTTLRIPLEHAALETRLRALRYIDSEETRLDQLRETSRIASELLAKVPGLIAELSTNRGSNAPFVHLSIVSRASELALFPFELAVSPDGLPGAGQQLTLQKQLPICLTRRSRNIRNDDFVWDRKIKILMVASDRGGPIPVMQHYALLRKLVEPWVGSMRLPPEQNEELPESISHRKTIEKTVEQRRDVILRLLVDANVNAIAEAVSNEVDETGEPFTHIHVLAHGADLPDTDRRSGIALHHPTQPGKIDIVDGRRLALTLGCLPDYPEEANRYQGPAVVTLATCSNADQGSVKISGASVAFDLHDSGIPLVVGSQFPLTTDGSVIMTEALYDGFLAGGDPRSTIWEARRALMAHVPVLPKNGSKLDPSSHDWASMTVYAALPDNLDRILPAHWSTRNQQRLNVRLENIQSLLPALRFELDSWWDMSASRAEVPFIDAADAAETEVLIFSRWTDTLENVDDSTRAKNFGILASAQKQIGLTLMNASLIMREKQTDLVPDHRTIVEARNRRIKLFQDGESWLRKSRDAYHRIFQSARNKTWALVQFLALDFAIRADFSISKWTLAQQLAKLDERSSQNLTVDSGFARRGDLATVVKQYHVQVGMARIDALAALLELNLLKAFRDVKNTKEKNGHERNEMYSLANRILQAYRDEPETVPSIISAVRQFRRYYDFAERALYRINTLKHASGLGTQAETDMIYHFFSAQGFTQKPDLSKERTADKRKKVLSKSVFGPAVKLVDDVLNVFHDIEAE